MDVVCASCQVKFKIPDEKVPQNQVFSLPCPKCREKITIDTRPSEAPATPSAAPPASGVSKTLAEEVSTTGYNAADRPFDFIEEGAKTALVCEQDPTLRAKLMADLQALGYHVACPQNAREVLKQMRFHVFDLIVVNEAFDTPDPDHNNILKYLERLGMEIRRQMFVAMLSDRFRTSDNMVAFNKSVNIIINLKNTNEFDKIIRRAVTDNEAFYKIYRESMKKAGRG